MSVSTPIALPDSLGNYHPQIELTNDNVPAILWTSATLKNLYFSRHDGVSGFEPPLQLNPTGLPLQAYGWSGPDLAIWQDNIYIVFKEFGYSTGHIYLVRSMDNGMSFGDTVRVDSLSTGYANYPDVAVSNDTVFVTFMDHDAGGLNPQYVVARSFDGGATFEPAVDVSAILGDEACDCCQPEIIVNEKYVVVFFRNNDSNVRDVNAVVSYDRGATFTNAAVVDNHLWTIMSCPSSGPDAAFSGTDVMITAYRSRSAGVNRVFINEYDLLADSSIITSELSLGTGVTPNYPQITYSSGNLGAVWEGRGADPDVFFNWSTSGVSGLDSTNILNVTDATGTQSKPDICYGNGKYHVVWSEVSTNEVRYATISESLSIEDRDPSASFNIYPNPSSETITVAHKMGSCSRCRLFITDVGGRMVLSTANIGDGFEPIDVSSWPAGIYMVSLIAEKTVRTEKLIVQP